MCVKKPKCTPTLLAVLTAQFVKLSTNFCISIKRNLTMESKGIPLSTPCHLLVAVPSTSRWRTVPDWYFLSNERGGRASHISVMDLITGQSLLLFKGRFQERCQDKPKSTTFFFVTATYARLLQIFHYVHEVLVQLVVEWRIR